MTFKEIQEQVMFQTNNDADDLGDFLPHVNDYINEGYDLIAVIWDSHHVPSDEYPRLENDDDEPMVPAWIQRYIADYATWLVYRNGNPQKQQRGRAYWETFMNAISKLSDMGGKNGQNDDGSQKQYKKFINIPV